jgi:hypothetical protein
MRRRTNWMIVTRMAPLLVGGSLVLTGWLVHSNSTKEPHLATDRPSAVYVMTADDSLELSLTYSINIESGLVTLQPSVSRPDAVDGGVQASDSVTLLLVGGAILESELEVIVADTDASPPTIQKETVDSTPTMRFLHPEPTQLITLQAQKDSTLPSLGGLPPSSDERYTFPTIRGRPLSPAVSVGSNRALVQVPANLGVIPIGCSQPRESGVDTVPFRRETLDLLPRPADDPSYARLRNKNVWWAAGHCTDSVSTYLYVTSDDSWRLDSYNGPEPASGRDAAGSFWASEGPRTGNERAEISGLSAVFLNSALQESAAGRLGLAGILFGIGGGLITSGLWSGSSTQGQGVTLLRSDDPVSGRATPELRKRGTWHYRLLLCIELALIIRVHRSRRRRKATPSDK